MGFNIKTFSILSITKLRENIHGGVSIIEIEVRFITLHPDSNHEEKNIGVSFTRKYLIQLL